VFGLFKKQCPKCDSKNIKTVKPSLWGKWKEAFEKVFFPLSILKKPTKPLNVCRDCGFSWEER